MSSVFNNQSNDSSFKDILDELKWRGLVAISTDEDELRKALTTGSITYYCGFDPTAASLHLGNLVQLLTMRRLQLAGHKPLALIGGSTGLVGDPRPTAERTLNTRETVEEWVEKLGKQAARFLSFENENAARMVNNLDWTAPISALTFLRDIGKHFSVNQMLSKDSVSARLEGGGISYTEFSYQVLQALDFLELYKRHNCTLQMGGSDQWGNIVMGIDLGRRMGTGQLYGLTSPLLTTASGAKMGKTASGAVWLNSDMLPVYDYWQYWRNTEDRDVGRFLKLFTELPLAEITRLERLADARDDQVGDEISAHEDACLAPAPRRSKRCGMRRFLSMRALEEL